MNGEGTKKLCPSKRDTDKGQYGPCFKVWVWMLTCVVLVVVSFLISISIWTIVSNQKTLSMLQDRIKALENERANIETIVEEKVNIAIEQVFLIVILY